MNNTLYRFVEGDNETPLYSEDIFAELEAIEQPGVSHETDVFAELEAIEYEEPAEESDLWGGLKVMAGQMPSMVTDVIPETVGRAIRRGDEDLDESALDMWIEKNKAERERAKTLTPEEREKTWFKVPFTDITVTKGHAEDAADSIGYSIVNAATTFGAKAATSIALAPVLTPIGSTIAGTVAGFGAGTAISQGATKDQFVEMVKNEFLNVHKGEEMTPELQGQWKELYNEIENDADWYGFWEAAPETAGNLLTLGIAKLKPGKLVAPMLKGLKVQVANRIGVQIAKKAGVPVAKLAAMLTEESITEMVTQKKQADVELERGFRDKPLTYSEALEEVLPMVLTTTPIMGGGIAGGAKLAERMAAKKQDVFDDLEIIEEGKELKLEEKPPGTPKPDAFNKIKQDYIDGNLSKKDLEYMKTGLPDTEPGEQQRKAIDDILKEVPEFKAEVTPEDQKRIDSFDTMGKRTWKDFVPGQMKIAPETDETKSVQGVADALKMGNVVFYNAPETQLNEVNGFYNYDTGEIYVNKNSENPLLYVAGHESLHRLNEQAPDLYKNLITTLKGKAFKYEEYATGLNLKRGLHGLEDLTKAESSEEFIADFAARAITTPGFWNKLNAENPTTTRKLAEILIDLINQIRKTLGVNTRKYFENIDAVEELAKTYAEFAKRASPEAVETTEKETLPVTPKAEEVAETTPQAEPGIEFKTTGEAVEFGKKATKEEVVELRKLNGQAKAEQVAKLQESSDIGTKAQFYNEAIQAAEGRDFDKWKETSSKDFNKAVDNSTKPQFLYRYTGKELDSFLTFTSHNGKVGYALTPEKDIVNVFNNTGVRGAGVEAMVQAISKGGETLGCFDGDLRKYYEKFGFKVYKQEKWNQKHAPKHWDYGVYDKPDVVFMRYEGGTRNAIDIRRDYEAARLQRTATGKQGRLGVSGGVHRKHSQKERRRLDKGSPATTERPVGTPSHPSLKETPSPKKEYKESEISEKVKPYEDKQQTFDFKFKEEVKGIPEKRVRMATTGSIAASSTVVRNVDEAASLLSHIRKSAQEIAYTVAVDKDGTILEIHKYSKGRKDAAMISVVETAGRILNIPNVDHAYFIHNHPSASTMASDDDIGLASSIGKALELKNIGLDSFVIAGTRYRELPTTGQPLLPPDKAIKPIKRTVRVPEKERAITGVKAGELSIISQPWMAIEHFKDELDNQEGFLFLSVKNEVVGFLKFTPGEKQKAITTNLISTAEKLNASGFVFNSNVDVFINPKRKRFLKALGKQMGDDLSLHDIISAGKSLYDADLIGAFHTDPKRRIDTKGNYEVIGSKEPLFSLKDKPSAWYSQMEKTLEQKIPGKGTPESMKQAINAFAKKGEFKAEELEWSGVNEWLSEQSGKVTKQEVLTYLKENNVQIREVVKGDEIDPALIEQKAEEIHQEMVNERVSDIEDEQGQGLELSEDSIIDISNDISFPYEEAEEVLRDEGAETKFHQYVEPGGENYREVLLTLPAVGKATVEQYYRSGQYAKDYEDLGIAWEDLNEYQRKLTAEAHAEAGHKDTRQMDYTGGHYDENDVLVHIRLDERTDTAGNNVLHISEIQSDWASDIRKKGVKRKTLKKLPEGYRVVEVAPLDSGIKRKGTGSWVVHDKNGNPMSDGYLDKELAVKRALEVLSRSGASVLDMPFKKTYYLLAMKKMVRAAAEGGFDAVTWDKGAVHFNRWGSERITWKKHKNGWLVDVKEQVGGNVEHEGQQIDIEAMADAEGMNTQSNTLISDKAGLRDMIDSIAQRERGKYSEANYESMVDARTKKTWDRMQKEDVGVSLPRKESFENIYDKMLVNEVNKFFNKKKWGNAKVSVGTIKADNAPEEVVEKWAAQDPDHPLVKKNRMEIWTLKLTPEIKQKALREGMPMFSVKDKKLSPLAQEYLDMLIAHQPKKERPAAIGIVEKIMNPVTKVMSRPMETGETLGEVLIRKMQDKYVHLKKLQYRLGEGSPLEEKMDVYLSEELFHGKTAYQLEQFEKKYADPLLKQMTDADIDAKTLDRYLYAKHAPERNARIQKINPEMAKKGIPGSGMSDKQSQEILTGFDKKGLTPQLEKMAKRIYAINQAKLRLFLKAGMITQEQYDSITNTYENYVPLRGKDGEISVGGVGRGIDVATVGLHRALGRKSEAQSPLAWSLGSVEEAIVKIQKNEIGKKLLNLVKEFPDKNLWTIDEITLKQRWNPVTEEVEKAKVPAWAQPSDEMVHVFEEGKRYNIKIKDKLLAKALLNLGTESSNVVTRGLSRINRYLAAVNTSLNPEFVLSNFVRDLQTAGINITSEQSAKMTKDVLKDVPTALRHAYRGYRGTAKDTAWDKWFKQYRASGGSIGFFGLRGVGDRVKTIEAMIAKTKKGKVASAKRGISELGNFISDVNAAVENAVRLSAFKNAVESGMSVKQAASLSKNLTVNFNRKGELGGLMNALYLFYNAGIQGIARVVQVLKTPKARKLGAGIIGTAFMLTELNRMMGGDDPEDERNYYDKIPDYEKERNIIFMLPGTEGKYIKFPLPYGYNVFWVVGERVNTGIHSGKPVKAAKDVLIATMNAFNPIGGDATLIRTLSPTLSDVPLDLYMNQNFAGYPIKPEQPPYALEKPESQLYWKSVSPISKALAEKVNRLTGGNAIRPGGIDVSPEVLDYMVGTMTGAAGAFVNRSLNVPVTVATGEAVEIRKMPFVRKVLGEQTQFYSSREYRKISNEIETQVKEKKAGLAKRKVPQSIVDSWKSVKKRIAAKRKRIKRIEKGPMTEDYKKTKIDEVREEIRTLQKGFIRKYDKIK